MNDTARRTRTPWLPWLVVVGAVMGVCGPGTARADGGLFVRRDVLEDAGRTVERAVADETISSNGQRALLRRQAPDGCWELTVEPGRVRVAGAAWILPLPVAPSYVQPAAADFLSELTALTQPVVTQQIVVVSGPGRAVPAVALDGRGARLAGPDGHPPPGPVRRSAVHGV